MTLRELRSITFFALALAAIFPTQAKLAASANAEVQMLANFPALQRLAAKSDAKSLRRYLARVSTAYRQVDYDAFAQALPRTGSLITLFGDSRAANPGTLKKARATLRRLEAALAQNRRIVLPARAGERIPDYYGIATAFTENAARAIQNLAAGKSVANFLRKETGAFWITNFSPSEFGFSSTAFGNININSNFSYNTVRENSTMGVTTTGSGALTLSGSNTYTGATMVAAGTLTLNGTSPSGYVLNMNNNPNSRWIAFGPDVAIPSDLAGQPTLVLNTNHQIESTSYLAGTRFLSIPVDMTLPPDATEVPAPFTLTPAASPTPTPSPSPTPAQ